MPYLGLYLAKTEAQSSIWTLKMGAKWNVKFLSDSLLGCPIQNELLITTGSEQQFENGYMLWRKDKDQIYVVHEHGERVNTFQMFDNQWLAGNPGYSCKAFPSPGQFQPQMGFGRVWCQLGAATASIGWALTEEESYFDPGETETDFIIQNFEYEVIFRNSEGGREGFAHVLFSDGTFQRLSLIAPAATRNP